MFELITTKTTSQEIMADITRVEKIETQTIAVQEARGQLTLEDRGLVSKLQEVGINCQNLTLSEAWDLNDFIDNATDDIVNEKTESIMTMLWKVMNGAKNRREWKLDPVLEKRLDRLIEKWGLYDQGKFDISSGFDISKYPGNPDDRSWVLCDDMSKAEIESHSETFTVEELVENGFIRSEDVFVYGPYTHGDLEDMRVFLDPTVTTGYDQRTRSRLEKLLDETIGRIADVEMELVRGYISTTVLPSRRLSAKNLLILVCEFGKMCNREIFKHLSKLPEDELTQKDIKSLINTLYSVAWHADIIVRKTRSEAIKNNKPPTDTFYETLAERVNGWDDVTASQKDKDFHSYLVKIDGFLSNAEILYADLLDSIKIK